MSRPDATAGAQLEQDVVKPVWLGYLDFLGDPTRANTSGRDLTPTGTGDTDLDGHLFGGLSAELIDISPVKAGLGGSSTVVATLSGIPGLDDVMDLIGDKANWQGRPFRLWRIIRNAANVQQGAIQHYYTGYMTAAQVFAGGDSQKLSIEIETYLAAFGRASNRTYMSQEKYDAGDLSAKAAIAIANGNGSNPATSNTDTVGVVGRAIRGFHDNGIMERPW
jgi:hypothetical protein